MCMKVYDKHIYPTHFGHSWPPSGTCVTKDRYIEIHTKVCEPVHRCKILGFKIHGLKYIFLSFLNFNMCFKPCIFKTQCFTSVDWFRNFCNISMYPSFVKPLPEEDSGDLNVQEVCYVYIILSYTCIHLLPLLPYLIAQCMVMDH